MNFCVCPFPFGFEGETWDLIVLIPDLCLSIHFVFTVLLRPCYDRNYSRLSLSRNRRDPQKQFEISVLRHIRFVVLRKKQFEQPNFTNDYVI